MNSEDNEKVAVTFVDFQALCVSLTGYEAVKTRMEIWMVAFWVVAMLVSNENKDVELWVRILFIVSSIVMSMLIRKVTTDINSVRELIDRIKRETHIQAQKDLMP